MKQLFFIFALIALLIVVTTTTKAQVVYIDGFYQGWYGKDYIPTNTYGNGVVLSLGDVKNLGKIRLFGYISPYTSYNDRSNPAYSMPYGFGLELSQTYWGKPTDTRWNGRLNLGWTYSFLQNTELNESLEARVNALYLSFSSISPIGKGWSIEFTIGPSLGYVNRQGSEAQAQIGIVSRVGIKIPFPVKQGEDDESE